MKMLKELLLINEFAPEQPGTEQPEQKVGHEIDPNHPSPDDEGKGEKSQHNENAKEKLSKLFSDADEANELKVYKHQTVFDIRQSKKDEQVHINYPGEISKTVYCKEGQYILRKSEEVNKMKVIEKDDFEEKYELINPNEKPDAEGYASYRLKSEVVAFQYHEKDILDLNVSGHFIKIKPEDYVCHPLTNSKKLIVMSKTDFETKYRLS